MNNRSSQQLLYSAVFVQYCTQQLQRWTHSALLRAMLHRVSGPNGKQHANTDSLTRAD